MHPGGSPPGRHGRVEGEAQREGHEIKILAEVKRTGAYSAIRKIAITVQFGCSPMSTFMFTQ